MADRIGQQFGNYRLVHLLGEGGFAKVYLGEHIYLDTQAAIKVLQTQLKSKDVEYFRTEARTIAHLNHPHIVRVLEFGVEDKTPFLVMEYAPKGTVRMQYPKGTRLPLETIIAYVKQIANALYYIHEEKKLVHRDVKPENMLLQTNQHLLLSDFGIVVAAHTTGSLLLESEAGTPAYMAPEQLQGRPRPASDQYALGITVYEWLLGDGPFRGSFSEIVSQHMLTPPPFLHEEDPTISLDVEQVVLRALAKDSKERFADIQSFARALEHAGQQALISAVTSPSPLQPVSPSPSEPPTLVTIQITSQHTLLLPAEQPELITLLPKMELVPPSPKELAFQSNKSKGAPPLPISSPANRYPISGHRRGLPWGKAALFIGLVLLTVASAALLYPLVINSNTHSMAMASATARANATATGIVNAYNTATARSVMFGFDAQHTNFNPYEKILNPTNVSELVQGWIASTAGETSTPIVANGVVYITSDDGKLYAFNASGCGHPSCLPLWTASIGGYGGGYEPAVANGVVYVHSTGAKLYAFNASGCGHPLCSPLWTASIGTSTVANTSPPTVANGIVYVNADDKKLYAFNAAGCGHPLCSPLWTASNIVSSSAVANGIVYVNADDKKLYAFKAAGCGHPSCLPLWIASIGGYGFSPMVANGVVYVKSYDDGKLYAFNAAGCGHPLCSPLWTASSVAGEFYSGSAAADGVVYVGSGIEGKLFAFNAAGCGHPSCSPLWTAYWADQNSASGGTSQPVVANGVVYVGGGFDKLYAFKTSGCGHLSCSPLWTTSLPIAVRGSGSYGVTPVIANGGVYVNVSDLLFTFHLPGLAP